MNSIELFKNESFGEIRTLLIEDEVWFVGKDVAGALGYLEPRSAISKKVDEEDRGVAKMETPSGKQDMTIINESGLYSLILSSKLPQAKEFKRWVTNEILPTIRKHGTYITPQKLEEVILNPDTLIQLATTLKEEQQKNKQLLIKNSELSVDNQIMKPKAEYFDELVDRNLLTSIRETAKLLNIKEKEFVNFLLGKKYLYRDKKGKLTPYANKNNDLFEMKECFNEKTSWRGSQTLITPKGRETFRLLLV